MIFDSHAHYDDAAFDPDREALLESLPKNGVGYVINVSSDLASVQNTIALTRKYGFLFGALGIHPSDVAGLSEEDLDWIHGNLAGPKIVAVGEIGLDYHWEKEGAVRERQREWFARQLQMAARAGKTAILHSRDAAQDTYKVMETVESALGRLPQCVLHCFSYTKEMAEAFSRWDVYFGVGGVVTFPNAKKTKEAVEAIPLERILLETDCPYLSPVPHRGERNSSLNLPLVAEEIARIKHIPPRQVMDVTCGNAKRAFGIGQAMGKGGRNL